MAPQNMNVAIVDDDDGAREALEFLLTSLGQAPEGFASGALFLASKIDRFACLIVDQQMPGMTGLEVAQSLRQFEVDIPIMLISGSLTADVIHQASLVGVSVVSEKPPELDVLFTFIGTALS